MPFYDYKCTKCNYVFEEFQSIIEDVLLKCPKCGELVKRLISNTSIQVVLDARELKEKIKQDVKKDVQDIRNGDWEKAADYLGEKGALEFYGKK